MLCRVTMLLSTQKNSNIYPLPKQFFLSNTHIVAKKLLSCALFYTFKNKTIGGQVVETESYTYNDPASHSYKGITLRSTPMFKKAGTVYVYVIYGIYHCLNVVTSPEGVGEAVLIRAIMPLWGDSIMHKHRAKNKNTVLHAHMLCSGPGRLCIAMNITKKHNNNCFLTDGSSSQSRLSLALLPKHMHPKKILSSPRIGITYQESQHLKQRFFIKDNPYISKKTPQ